LKHFWFKSWPDHNVPDIKTLIPFINTVYNDIKINSGSTVIHCSAGIGRSGVVYLILKLMFKHNFTIQDINKIGTYPGKKISISEIINELKSARQNRMALVEKITQFNLIANILEVTDKITEKIFKNIPRVRDIVNTKTNYNGYRLDFDIANTIFSTAINNNKNRYFDILPYNDKRVNYIDEPNFYINASHMEHFVDGTNNYNVIITQGPKQNTIEDFRHMLVKSDIKRVIMLANLEENKEPKCIDYTGDLKQSTNPDFLTSYKITEKGFENISTKSGGSNLHKTKKKGVVFKNIIAETKEYNLNNSEKKGTKKTGKIHSGGYKKITKNKIQKKSKLTKTKHKINIHAS
jgi:protein tyrosine phosphatase